MDLKDIGQFIKIRRDSLQMRQEDLADMSQTGLKTIQLVELGKGNPSVKTLQKIGEVLGLEVSVRIKQVSDG